MLTCGEIANRSKNIFEKNRFVKRAYLFGSYARNEADDKSDIDFMIEIGGDVGLEFFGLYDYLQEEFHKKVDVITMDEAERIMEKTIKRDKVLIYER